MKIFIAAFMSFGSLSVCAANARYHCWLQDSISGEKLKRVPLQAKGSEVGFSFDHKDEKKVAGIRMGTRFPMGRPELKSLTLHLKIGTHISAGIENLPNGKTLSVIQILDERGMMTAIQKFVAFDPGELPKKVSISVDDYTLSCEAFRFED